MGAGLQPRLLDDGLAGGRDGDDGVTVAHGGGHIQRRQELHAGGVDAEVIGELLGIGMIVFGAVKVAGYLSRDLFRLAFQYDLAHPVQGALDRVDLDEDVLAGHVLVDHLVDGLQLAHELLHPAVQVLRIHALSHTSSFQGRGHYCGPSVKRRADTGRGQARLRRLAACRIPAVRVPKPSCPCGRAGGRSRVAFASGESYTGPGSVPHPLHA